MKGLLKIIIVAAILVLITFGCFKAYQYFTGLKDNETKFDPGSVARTQVAAGSPDGKLYTLEEFPKVDASLATQPLMTALVSNFVGEEVDDEKLEYSNTHPGYLALVDGKKDLIIVTEPSEEELEYAKSKNVELEVIPVVNEAFVFYVNSANKVNSLTLEQIQDIYSGKITNWSDVGGNNAEIRAFQRPVNSGSQTGMLSLVMKDKPLMTPPKEDLVDTMEAIVNLVSDYDNGKDAIGYSYYYYATTMFDTIDETVKNKIKLLGVNGVVPNNETIKDGSYPLHTNYYIVIRKDEPTNGIVRKVVYDMLSSRAQKVAESIGYVGMN